MRREFILVLLGIICISTLSSILSGYVQIDNDKVLLDTVVGVVGAGNFSYWQLGHVGPLLVELTSLSGDADLYVSDSTRPSYEVDKNNFSSMTCGPDMVYVPTDFPRPVGIGVFGYWSHSVSEYSIRVFLDKSALLSHHEMLILERNSRQSDSSEPDEKQDKDKMPTKKSEEDRKPRILRLFNMLDMLLEMFIL